MDRAELSDYSGLLGRLVGDRRGAPTAAAVAVNEDQEDRLGRIEAAIAALTAKIAVLTRPMRLAGDRHSTLYCSFCVIFWRCWGHSDHRIAQSQSSGLRWLLISCSRIPVLSGQGLRMRTSGPPKLGMTHFHLLRPISKRYRMDRSLPKPDSPAEWFARP